MTQTYATCSHAVPRAATPDDLELTVTESERDDVHHTQPRCRSYSDVVAKRVPSEEENSDKENINNQLPLDEEINAIRNARTKLSHPGDGPSRDKGKGVDPWNWGNIHFSDKEETHPDVQEKAYNEWKAHQRNYLDINHRPVLPGLPTKPVPTPSTAKALNLEILRELKAIRAENAHLQEQQSDKAAKKHAWILYPSLVAWPPWPPREHLPEMSMPIYDQANNSQQTVTLVMHSSTNQPRAILMTILTHCPMDSTKKKQYRDLKKRSCLIKPTPPEPYDGSADSQMFYRFMRESKSYVKEGQVAFNASEWMLNEFFTSLFDYCFPTNYILKQRKKLKTLYQNGKTVKEYVSELIELFTIIGEISE
ncbi:hypothetical protein BDN71DRAFT_1435517 [Pleurotus eryngii]|uniref:Retrotransposon gag domain-containing protein n=1 Tax=Pleurotus eryngii TaxID=5323 RepID=A0A9P6D352_PLEER|nr:hypothetical protein BDN71DRAFT_1435517 [Pleurotus eryngii]